MLALLSGGCPPKTDEVPFLKHWVIDPNPNTGRECCSDILALGDINGDGNLDIVLGAEQATDPGLVWYEFPSWEKHPVAKGEFTTDGEVADMDGDGDLDIAIGTLTGQNGEIRWYENTGHPESDAWPLHVIGAAYAHDLDVADLDGDGDMDVISCDKNAVVAWYNHDGSYVEKTLLRRPGEGLAKGDIDGDGDPDIVYGGTWLENPGPDSEAQWSEHDLAPDWPAETRVALDDFNNDGRVDVVLSVSEGEGPLSWFENPEEPKGGRWIEHPVSEGILTGAHSLQTADFDLDGDIDILTAEMHTSRDRRVILYLNEGDHFSPHVLSAEGSHNMQIGDIDRDGDTDIVGKNYGGIGRSVEMWENLASPKDAWTYIPVDQNRPKSEQGKMGLCFADANRDGFSDILAGGFLYLNPAGVLANPWTRTALPGSPDCYVSLDINDNGRTDILASDGPNIVWLEAPADNVGPWTSTAVASIPEGRTQGYLLANLTENPRPQFVFSRGEHLFCLEIPAAPGTEPWPLHLLSTATSEEAIAAGDIDHDGDLDLAASLADGEHLVWLENPGTLGTTWETHPIGSGKPWVDRIGLADFDSDGRLDLVVTEERQDGAIMADLTLFHGPGNPKLDVWDRTIIARHRSLNSMDLADFNGDGAVDIAVAEHTDLRESKGAVDNLTLVYLNDRESRSWIPTVVERGPHSSHLGARTVDLDNDGHPEIVSIGWNQFRFLHLWAQIPATTAAR
ncbi:MAG: VCBS repeat-containing protein [Opitutaceae bacterium]